MALASNKAEPEKEIGLPRRSKFLSEALVLMLRESMWGVLG